MTRLATVLKLAFYAGLVASAVTAKAQGQTAWNACVVADVSAFSNRVHVRCSNSETLHATYFAVPTASTSEAARFLTMGTTALTTGRVLHIEAKIAAWTGDGSEDFGCLVKDCRRALAVVLLK
jgi:hypothetical protein